MPTLILLDTSLSMAKKWNTLLDTVNQTVNVTKLECTCRAVKKFVQSAADKFKLEPIALYTFSSETKCVVDFTRDYDQLLKVLDDVAIGDTSVVRTAVERAFEACMKDATANQQHSAGTPYRILLFTDGDFGEADIQCNDEILATLAQSVARIRDDHGMLSLHTFVVADGDASHGYDQENSVLARLTSGVNRSTLLDALESASENSYAKILCGFDGRASNGDNEADWRLFPYFVASRTEASLQRLVDALVDDAYAPVTCTLRCGALRTRCELRPRPIRERLVHFDESLDIPRRLTLASRELRVVACAPLAEIGAPPTSSRYSLVPVRDLQASVSTVRPSESAMPSAAEIEGSVPEEEVDAVTNTSATGDSQLHAANSAVLLHGALKAENLVAVVQVAPAWFALVHPRTDVKKRSNLVLTILPPGCNCVPWLSSTFSSLAVRRALREAARQKRRARQRAAEDDKDSSTAPKRARSVGGEATKEEKDTDNTSLSDVSSVPSDFSSDSESDAEAEELSKLDAAAAGNTTASYSTASAYQTWTRAAALHSDVQRVLRSARKFEKQAAFFRELNRLKRFALQLGFSELLTYVSALLDGEYQAVVASGFSISEQPEKSHVAAQLRSVALQLRTPVALSLDYQILPAQAAVLTIPPQTGAQTASVPATTAPATNTSTSTTSNTSAPSVSKSSTSTSRASAAATAPSQQKH